MRVIYEECIILLNELLDELDPVNFMDSFSVQLYIKSRKGFGKYSVVSGNYEHQQIRKMVLRYKSCFQEQYQLLMEGRYYFSSS